MENNIMVLRDNNIKVNLKFKDNEQKDIIIFKDTNAEEDVLFDIELNNNNILNIYIVAISSNKLNINGNVNILGSHSNCHIINLLIGEESSLIKSNINIKHNVLESTSNLDSYAIAKEDATIQIINNGTIKMGAHKSVVHQSAKGLALSKTSCIDAKPNLFIDDYDVEASHACSIGSVNKEDLFYLMSRGLKESDARKLIVNGYITPIIDSIKEKELKEEIIKRINQII